MKEIEKVLHFMMEIEKLKNVYRKTRPIGLRRFENSAEHSWHVCISALMLKNYADEIINIDRVIAMLLIHDLGEIDADDIIIYQSETPQQKAKEEECVKRILELLPDHQGDEYMELWREFEAGESADSRFARAIDRVPPLLHNVYGEGHSWQKYGIKKDQVMQVNRRIEKGSKSLWSVMEKMLEEADKEGLFSN